MLVNTSYFSEAANFKTKHGVYTHAPFGSKEYRDFWAEQDDRCLNGYSVGGVRITGQHYFFLNFKQLEIVKDTKAAASEKERTFPRFWEAHYKFFLALEEAEKAGKHMCILKPRGSGFSEIMSSCGVHDYSLIRGSKSFYFASNVGFLNKDGVITKCWDHLEFLNSETEKGYRHLRQVKNQDLHKRASQLDPKTGNEYGYKSEIIARVIDHPRKVRGARTGSRGKVYFEEGGSFPNLKDAVITTRPLVEQGGVTTGQIVVWGTGGEKGPGIEGLEHMFYHPDAYNMMSWENKWDEDRVGTRCCYFIPVYTIMDKFMDHEGNADDVAAKNHHDVERKRIHKEDPTAEDKYIAEYPYTPGEALIRLNDNLFPVVELQKQLLRVQTDSSIKGFLKHGCMERDVTSGKAKFRLVPKSRPITEFPHQQGDNLTGCTTIVESPYRDQLGHVPGNLYLIIVDPYYKDDSDSKISLAAAYVYKHYNNLTPTEDDLIVAWHVSRPEKLEDFYRELFLLAEYYNATIQSEIAGGGKGILDYATYHKLKHYCEKEPDIFYNKEVTVKSYSKPYFMNMAGDRPQLAHAYLSDWLRTERSAISEEGNQTTIKNLNKIYDEGLLKELIKFNSEGNFDRVSAMRLLPFMIKDRVEAEYRQRQELSQKSFWDREFHSSRPNIAENQMSPADLNHAANDSEEIREKQIAFDRQLASYNNTATYLEDFG
jgi:hypothetical protein